jgi:hypothetical protein
MARAQAADGLYTERRATPTRSLDRPRSALECQAAPQVLFMTAIPWNERLTQWSKRLERGEASVGVLDVLEDFSTRDWTEFLCALAWRTADLPTLERVFCPQHGEELLPVVATALDQLGGGALRQMGLALDALVRRHCEVRDADTAQALLTLLKLTGMLSRGANPDLLQQVARDSTQPPELRRKAASALCGYKVPYDATFWGQLDYEQDPFFIPAGLSFYAWNDPRRALQFLTQHAEHYDQPRHLEAATGTALFRLLTDEGVAGAREGLANATAPAIDIVNRALLQPKFERFGPDLAAQLHLGEKRTPSCAAIEGNDQKVTPLLAELRSRLDSVFAGAFKLNSADETAKERMIEIAMLMGIVRELPDVDFYGVTPSLLKDDGLALQDAATPTAESLESLVERCRKTIRAMGLSPALRPVEESSNELSSGDDRSEIPLYQTNLTQELD